MQFRQEENQLKANYMSTVHLQLKLEIVKLEQDFAIFPAGKEDGLGLWVTGQKYLGLDH